MGCLDCCSRSSNFLKRYLDSSFGCHVECGRFDLLDSLADDLLHQFDVLNSMSAGRSPLEVDSSVMDTGSRVLGVHKALHADERVLVGQVDAARSADESFGG